MPRLVLITLTTRRPPTAAPPETAGSARPRGVLATALAAGLTAFAAGLATSLGGALARVVGRAVAEALARGAGS